MELPKPVYDEPEPPKRTMPKSVADCMRKLGLDRKPGETAHEQALRAKQWLKQHGDVLNENLKANLD